MLRRIDVLADKLGLPARARGTRALNGEGEELRSLDQKLRNKNRKLKRLRQQLEEKDQELAELRAQLVGERIDPGNYGIKAENIIWIFCTGRSGSTWLGTMMGELRNHAMWNEPLVGALFGEFYYERAAHKRGAASILGTPHRELWLKHIRSMVLEGTAARYPEADFVVIKEPHGSTGAPLLSAALPESNLVFLVRDPRDVAASALDGNREGSWTSKAPRWRKTGKPKTLADTDPDTFMTNRANTYVRDVGKAREAFEAHAGPKALVRYEDLRADTLGEMRRLYRTLGIPVEEVELRRVVEEHAFENIPEENKGEGKFYRKASPGSWREDLTPQQVEIVEEITAPLLKEFYPENL